jgi:hypothetical protein
MARCESSSSQRSGRLQEVNTGCRDRGAAQTMLSDLERRAELVRSGVMTASDESVADHQADAAG